MAAVAITRTDLSAAELRTSAARMKDARAVRRTLAIALVLDGTSRAAAAAASGMDRQTLRDWVHRYNAGGLDGLSDQWAPGPEPALTRTQEQALIGWVELGPDLARDGVVRWRRADLRDRVLREFGVTVHERTVGKWLGQHGYCRLSVRPQHPKSDLRPNRPSRMTSPTWCAPRSHRKQPASRSRSGGRTRPVLASKAH